jgi:predicted molibdopterin-dependent oxidoreductase YjgC
VPETIALTVDGETVEVPVGSTVLDACDRAGSYVPRLCAYPGLDPLGDCGLCFVNVDGGEARRACSVAAVAGMVIDTLDAEARGFRAASMKAILGDHPHVCLTCPQRDGCSRDDCMYGNPPGERCCGEFGRCEIAKVAAYVGALEAAPSYVHRRLGETVDHNIRRDLDLCIGCARCVAACDTLEEAGSALMLVETDALLGAALPNPRSYLGRHLAVPKADDLRSSGCTFCGACIMVCPTGALTAVGRNGATWLAKRRERTTLQAPVLPPEHRLTLKAEVIEGEVPTKEGVFRLFDANGNVVQISGVMDLRAALLASLDGSVEAGACTFRFEEDPMYTQCESEMLAHHLREHGRMPKGNDVLGDLFGDDDGDDW